MLQNGRILLKVQVYRHGLFAKTTSNEDNI